VSSAAPVAREPPGAAGGCRTSMPVERADRGRIGYLLKCFPRLSETFILNEVLELERQGVDLRVYSMNEPNEPIAQRLAERVRSPIDYLPFPLRSHAPAYLRAHALAACRHPLRWLRTLCAVLCARDRDLFERFVQAGELARRLDRDGVAHLHAGFVHFPGSVAWLVHRMTGRSFSLATHARDIYLSQPGLLRRKLTTAKVVFTCTAYNVPHLRALAAPAAIARLRHVYHGVDLERFPFAPASTAEPPLLLTVGRLVAKKGLDHLIAACGLLRDRGRRFRCRIIAGSRDLWDELRAQIRALDLGGSVTLEGPLDQDEVRAAYPQATLFVLPCVIADDGDRDGIPNVLVEAAAAGVPIVSTPVSGITELLTDGESACLVPPRDPAAIAAAVERLLDAPDLRARLRQRARARVEAIFDLRRNAVAVARELAECLQPSARTPFGAPPRVQRAAGERVP
jgi:glycosyltransferase involved in cell wall biosynthesis